MPTNAELTEMARAERGDIVAFLRRLTPDQWEHPSLCDGWTVKDVAAHILLRFPVRLVLSNVPSLVRFNVHRLNQLTIDHYRNYSPEQVLGWFEQRADRLGLLMRYGPLGIRAHVIHHQDMRRPLGLPSTTPPERAAAATEAVATKVSANLGSRERAAGLRLRATDVDWSLGDGPEVTGTAEAILMAVAGRRHALGELSGDGKDILASRVG